MKYRVGEWVQVVKEGTFYGKVGRVIHIILKWHYDGDGQDHSEYEVEIGGVGIRTFTGHEIERAGEKVVAKYHVGESVWIGVIGNPRVKVGRVVSVIRRQLAGEDFIYEVLVSGVEPQSCWEYELSPVGYIANGQDHKPVKQDYHFKVNDTSEIDLPRIVREAEAGVDAILVVAEDTAWLLLETKLAKKMRGYGYTDHEVETTSWRYMGLLKSSIYSVLQSLRTARAEKPVETKKIVISIKAV